MKVPNGAFKHSETHQNISIVSASNGLLQQSLIFEFNGLVEHNGQLDLLLKFGN